MPDGTIEVKIQGMAQIRKAFDSSPQIVEPFMQKAISTSADILAKWTTPEKQGGPVPYRTGFLVESFRRQESRLMAKWYPTVHYAGYVQFGTRFMKANPYMNKILSRSKQEINDVFSSQLKMAVSAIAEESKS